MKTENIIGAVALVLATVLVAAFLYPEPETVKPKPQRVVDPFHRWKQVDMLEGSCANCGQLHIQCIVDIKHATGGTRTTYRSYMDCENCGLKSGVELCLPVRR
jgi:5-methylcytosine-specific restriction endonuclease McrA